MSVLSKPLADEMITCGQATRIALEEALTKDPRVLVFGEDVADPQGGGIVGCTKGLSTAFGSRVRSTPISEQAIAGAAVGAAIAGMRPVAEIMLMNFITVAMDQIVNHAAKTRYMSGGMTSVPLTIRTMSGAGIGGAGQHSDMYEAWFAHVPGLKVVVPSNPADQQGLLAACIQDDDPCIFIETTSLIGFKGPRPPAGHLVPLGKAAIARSGSDVTVISYGKPVHDALAVAEKLSAKGVSVEVIDLRTVAPWDEEAVLESVARTGRAVVLHEAVKRFGVGAEISARIQEELFFQLKAPVRRVASKNGVTPFASALEKAFMWSQAEIEQAIMATMDDKAAG
jgi:pyruvate/2-oxoglutarate/acetoin dehydrogenase E1 component